ncbi:hypothetical protein L0666_03640 [Octadecabacter sp. CECT 8868]|uniref:hypothetical protein n=1 Tax=Octadecabacter algicola TaxID=2909342 RepID=UPI001F3479AA|nr:hypothetical protein [Octadecabacter algicola]MCF2904070.1 hypothetical protein [Octadecabacter algicola]
MRGFGVFTSVLIICSAPMLAQTDDNAPLSAIDWLSETVEQPEVAVAAPVLGTQATRIPDADEDPVAQSATTPNVSVQTLGGPAPRALGILAPEITGLPVDLWENSAPDTIAALMMAQQVDTLPAVQELIMTLSMSQANPPRMDAGDDAFFLARVDKLLDFGALERAQAMLEAASPDTPALFRRWFDVSLLTGTEDAACRDLQSRPDVAPTPSARVFCLARSGDWSAAALTLNTGLALDDIDADTGALLSRFLDPELFEDEPDLTPPDHATPLTFRMFEAIGTPLTTQGLPRAFSHADLRANVGWKAQLEAAERLARSGAIANNALMGLYTARVPAASGGVWERARAVDQLTTALTSEDEGAIDDALTRLWNEAQSVGVTVQMAQYFAPLMLDTGAVPADPLVFKFLLLSDRYEEAALNEDLAITDPSLAAIARGGDFSNVGVERKQYPLVRAAFEAEPDATLVEMASQGRTGEAILRNIATLQQGIDGDAQAFQDGIATLRALGLEDAARRISLQYLLLP